MPESRGDVDYRLFPAKCSDSDTTVFLREKAVDTLHTKDDGCYSLKERKDFQGCFAIKLPLEKSKIPAKRHVHVREFQLQYP
jgi:hypothetical protein